MKISPKEEFPTYLNSSEKTNHGIIESLLVMWKRAVSLLPV